jgi:transcriptional regulator with XRE-family HTH domain
MAEDHEKEAEQRCREEVGYILKKLRGPRTQKEVVEDLAEEEVYIPRSQLSQLEYGKRGISLEEVGALCEYFGVGIDVLIEPYRKLRMQLCGEERAEAQDGGGSPSTGEKQDGPFVDFEEMVQLMRTVDDMNKYRILKNECHRVAMHRAIASVMYQGRSTGE